MHSMRPMDMTTRQHAARVQSTRALGGDGDGGGFRNARERASARKATVSEAALFDECAMAQVNEPMNERLIRSFCSLYPPR